MKNQIRTKLRQTYSLATNNWIHDQTEALSNIVPELQPNLQQWLRDEPFSDIRIHGKHSLQTVLKLRRSSDVCSALLALDTYAKDPSKESALYPWEV